ncbi:MAG TPA: sigma-70 family RNA polymerase sigma factor [Streptosporangiaceae bacterium]
MADDDGERFEALYHEHFRGVLGYALARLAPEQAKDAAAETFLVAWRRLDELPPDPVGWLFGVARKVVAGQLRTNARRAALAERLAEADRSWPALAADPADQVAQRHAALTALARLSERDREVLTLVAWHGLTAAQAAEALGLGSLSLTVRLHRARRRLVSALAAADSERRPEAERPPMVRAASTSARPPSALQNTSGQRTLSRQAGRTTDASANRD